MVITKKILKNQAGASLVSVTIISGVLIGSMFYLYDRVSGGIETVEKYNEVAKSSLGLRGVMAYAKDLLDTRSCIDSTKFTGLPEYPCKLTDAGSLERLLISENVYTSLCNYYENNGKPTDGLQNYCGSGKPPLPLDKFTFNIKKAKISDQHLIYSVFDEQSDYSLKGQCLSITYESAMSSLHAGMATITTRVKLYKDEACAAEVLASGEAVDVFFPRQINEFTLVSNRSLSIGNTSKETDINILDAGSKITFHSPVLVNKNLYYPTSGFSSGVNVKFTDKIIANGDIFSNNGDYPDPVFTGTGEIWISKHPSFTGFQKGLFRGAKEKSLQVLFDPTLAPVNDTSLMDECNAYRNRKYKTDYCTDNWGTDRPISVFKQVGPGSYDIGMTKLGEFIQYDVKNAQSYTSRNYSNESIPSTAQSIIQDNDSLKKILSDDLHFISPNEDGFYIRINLLRDGIIEIRGASSLNDVNCYGDMLSGGEEWCYNSDKNQQTYNGDDYDARSLYKRTAENNPFDINKFKQDKDWSVPNDKFQNGKIYRYQKLTCDTKDCEIEEKIYNTILAKQDVPYFKIAGKVKKTTQGNRASQVYNVQISTDPVDTNFFTYKVTSSKFNFEPKDLCQKANPYIDDDLTFNYQTATIANADTNWSKFNGSDVSLSTKELDYLKGEFTYHEMCNQAPTPSPAYASYDADWSNESFNSWNFNPVDKSGAYKPNAAKTGYDKIFNLADNTVTNKITIDDTNHDLFHSYSILDRCVIKNTALRVKGFLTCRYMFIEQRKSNLEMIGSFIVDKLTIEKVPSNYEITWKNIYHPASRNSLVGNRELLSVSSCETTAANPVWARTGNRCDPSYLTDKAVPYTWTTFDPLCIIITGSPIPICKPEQRGYNFNIQRLYEHYGI